MNQTITPVILGADLNCYNVARAFHMRYGVKSYAFGRYAIAPTKYSTILSCVHLTRAVIGKLRAPFKILLTASDKFVVI